MKQCSKCDCLKSLNEFRVGRNSCLECERAYTANWRTTQLAKYEKLKENKRIQTNELQLTSLDYIKVRMCSSARARAYKKGLEFSLSPSDINIPTVCPILGIALSPSTGHARDSSPSLDRIDNTKGYTKDNTHVISFKANTIKSNSTLEDLIKVVNFFNQ